MKDKSIKSTMKSWIMLSDKELDDTQVYMKEQEGENVESMSEDREAIHYDRNAAGDSGIYPDNDGLYSDSNEEETESDIESKQNRRGRRRRLSRDEEVEQLVQEVGQEVVGADDEEGTLFHRRKRRQDKKEAPDSENTPEIQEEQPEVKKVDFKEVTTEKTKKAGREQQSDKTEKSGNMGKVFAAGIGIVLVLIIAGLGYQNQSLQKQNQKLKTQISALKKEKKQAEQASEEQALQTKNEDGVVVNTDKMFSSVKVGDKEYKLLGKVSDFTKDGWKLEALRNENATLVPGGKLEKDAYLTNTDGKKIGVIIRNMSDKNQKVSDCIITKLSFSKEMFDGQITLPGSLGFDSTEKELKAAGFKKDADGIYTYTSKKIKDDTIKAAMADGESVSEITLERAVDESSISTGNAAANTSASTAAGSATTTASDSSSAEQNSATADTTLTNNSNSASDAAEE